MVAEINEGFITKTKSLRGFLIESGQGCYIPAYQRPYAWDDKNISRLLEDVLHGIREIVHRPDTITFIGTIIAIHDVEYKTVKTLYKQELPSRVMTIIDGQQRICTAVMANIVFHNYISGAVEEFREKTEPPFLWISDKCRQLLENLKKTYVIEQDSGQGNYRYYPRVIRAYLDAWSQKQNQAEYGSPIAKLIWEYINFVELGNFYQFKFNPVDSTGNIIDRYNMIYEGFRYIQREVMKICREVPNNQHDFLDFMATVQSSNFPEEILGFPLSEDVRKYFTEGKRDPHYIQFCCLFRLMILACYLNNRVVIALVTAKNDDGAFNMFEGLNTTAEPLTAFETFKPNVVKLETLSEYEASPSKKHIAEIESYLDQYRKANEKQRAASEMLISFALSETGKKLQKDLNNQRLYLRNEFDELNNIEERRAFVRSVANMSSFMKHGWNIRKDPNSIFYPLKIRDEEALVGFEALRQLKHSITIAPLARFYQQALNASDTIRKHQTDEFIRAIKATVAFSFLWRGAKGGTDKIDFYYRNIMRVGVKIQDKTILPLARRPKNVELESSLSITNYKKALQLILEHKGRIHTKKEWVKRVSLVGVYDYPIVARFLLFCASDDTIPDNSNKGLIKRGREGCNPMLKLSRWNDSAYFSIEHVAPQSQNAGWQSDIYEKDETVHTLGNLILLPHEENNIIGDKSWKHKQLMYTLLAADTQDEFDSIKTKLTSEGLTLSKKAVEVLSKSRYLGICKSIALFSEPWSLDIIQNRTQRLAELAWDRLYPWLFS